MSEQSGRTGRPRDVPPPRPVQEPVEGEVVGGDSGLGPAARALADAVAGLLGGGKDGGDGGARDGGGRASGPSRAASGARAASGVLTDVIAAVTEAARSATDPSGAKRDARSGGRGAAANRTPSGVLGDLLDAAAPRLPIRDGERLRRAYPGASDGQIADALVARATRLTGAVGAATGGLAAARLIAPLRAVSLPLELGAQTVLVAAVEVVLVGELHELAGRPAPGDARDRAGAYLSSWTTESAVGATVEGGLFAKLGSAGAAAVRRRVTRRLATRTTSMAPLLVGASLAARANRKATTALADRLRADLRLPPAAPPS